MRFIDVLTPLLAATTGLAAALPAVTGSEPDLITYACGEMTGTGDYCTICCFDNWAFCIDPPISYLCDLYGKMIPVRPYEICMDKCWCSCPKGLPFPDPDEKRDVVHGKDIGADSAPIKEIDGKDIGADSGLGNEMNRETRQRTEARDVVNGKDIGADSAPGKETDGKDIGADCEIGKETDGKDIGADSGLGNEVRRETRQRTEARDVVNGKDIGADSAPVKETDGKDIGADSAPTKLVVTGKNIGADENPAKVVTRGKDIGADQWSDDEDLDEDDIDLDLDFPELDDKNFDVDTAAPASTTTDAVEAEGGCAWAARCNTTVTWCRSKPYDYKCDADGNLSPAKYNKDCSWQCWCNRICI